MSAAPAPAAETEGAEEPKKKKPIVKIILAVVGAIVLMVGVMFAAASKAKVDAPSKIKKEAPEATRFEKNYLQMDKELMTNITGSKKVMVVQVALMTHYDSRVFDNVKKHEFALRSAMLDVMRQTTESDVAKPDFRKELAAKLKTEVNELLEKFEDFGGIEDVFFTSFVMQ